MAVCALVPARGGAGSWSCLWTRVELAPLPNVTRLLCLQDSSKYIEVITRAKEVGQYDDLVKYLMMVRDKVKDPKVDTEIVVAYAMTDKLGDLESFITSAPLATMRCWPPDAAVQRAWTALARVLYLRIVTSIGTLAALTVRTQANNDGQRAVPVQARVQKCASYV
jgi:Region in Clathrin and VPS